jgi:hypothetical protein
MTMATNQPHWRMLDNLGDVNPVDYGGFFVYVDRTGVYAPEVELLESPDSDDAPEGWDVYRACIEKDPTRQWWYDRLSEVAVSHGMELSELQRMATSADTLARAMVYQCLFSHFGAHEFDSYPNHYAKRSHLPRRIRRYMPRKR